MIEVRSSGRLAFCLLDTNGKGGRVDGSIGIAIDHPRLRLQMHEDPKEMLLIGMEGLEDRVERGLAQLGTHLGVSPACRVELVERFPSHAGLGLSTQLLLSVGQAFCMLHRQQMPIRQLAGILRRGGTSGVGTATFERGGLVLDAGHTFGPTGEKNDFLPSSASGALPPPVVASHSFPAEWKVLCARSLGVHGLYGSEERDFFRSQCPTPDGEAEKVCWIVIMRLLAGIVERRLECFNEGIRALQECGFKRAVWRMQPPAVLRARDVFVSMGIASVALSSLGPTMFAIIHVKDEERLLASLADRFVAEGLHVHLWSSAARNAGATVHLS